MYNRYIPQPDGTYKRSRMADRNPPPPPPPVTAVPEPAPCLQEAPPPSAGSKQRRTPPHKPPQHSSVDGFLRNLLPKNFDTGDLMIVLLLLLMAGDCEEDKNTALLTLALYLFL